MSSNRLIFETRATKMWRYFKNGSLFFCFLFLVYFLICLLFINVSDKENTRTQDHLLKKSPDLIVVFTGDSGRIPYAMSVLKKNPQAKLIITGVSAQYTMEKFIAHFSQKIPELSLDPGNIILDSLASNTVENVIFTMRHLVLHPSLKDVLIISHDYHIMRIKLITDNINNLDDARNFYFLGLKKDYTNLRNLKILFKETFKIIKTMGFLLLWERNSKTLD